MELHDVKASQLVKDLSLSHGAISQWKKGLQKPSSDAIIKIAKYFGVSTDYLLTGEEAPDPNAPDGPRVVIPLSVKGAQLGFHKGGEDFTQDEIEQIDDFVKLLVARRKKRGE